MIFENQAALSIQRYFAHSLDTDRTSHCYKCDKQCPIYDKLVHDRGNDTLLLNISGNTCTDFSSFQSCGKEKCQRDAGKSMVIFEAYISERIAVADDVCISECVVDGPWHLVVTRLQDQMTTISVVIFPCIFGHPSRRARRFLISWRPSRFQVQKEFFFEGMLEAFGRTLEIDADCFWAAPPSHVELYYRTMAEFSAFDISDADAAAIADASRCDCSGVFEKLLEQRLASLKVRLDIFRDKRKGLVAAGAVKLNDAYFCELTNSTSIGRHGPRVLPTLLTKGEWYSFLKGRTLFPREHFLAQGYRAYAGEPFSNPYEAFLDQCDSDDQNLKVVTGNGMNAQCIFAVITFTFALIRPTFCIDGRVEAALQDVIGRLNFSDAWREASGHDAAA